MEDTLNSIDFGYPFRDKVPGDALAMLPESRKKINCLAAAGAISRLPANRRNVLVSAEQLNPVSDEDRRENKGSLSSIELAAELANQGVAMRHRMAEEERALRWYQATAVLPYHQVLLRKDPERYGRQPERPSSVLPPGGLVSGIRKVSRDNSSGGRMTGQAPGPIRIPPTGPVPPQGGPRSAGSGPGVDVSHSTLDPRPRPAPAPLAPLTLPPPTPFLPPTFPSPATSTPTTIPKGRDPRRPPLGVNVYALREDSSSTTGNYPGSSRRPSAGGAPGSHREERPLYSPDSAPAHGIARQFPGISPGLHRSPTELDGDRRVSSMMPRTESAPDDGSGEAAYLRRVRMTPGQNAPR